MSATAPQLCVGGRDALSPSPQKYRGIVSEKAIPNVKRPDSSPVEINPTSKSAKDGIRTRASEEIGALNRRLRPTRPPPHAAPRRKITHSSFPQSDIQGERMNPRASAIALMRKIAVSDTRSITMMRKVVALSDSRAHGVARSCLQPTPQARLRHSHRMEKK